ncbi:MAG: GntR family transcriptional regulator [Lawsonibacter sp.]
MAEKESLKLQAYNAIKKKLVSCEYAPNTLLNEELLREELHVSRTPIRDALSRLEQEGMITILPKKGIMVSGMSINDINMVFEVRLMYEPYALLNFGSKIPYETLTHFYNQFSDLSALTEPKDYYQVDDAFHATIIQAMGNRYLRQSYDWIHDQNLRFRVLTAQASSLRLENSTREHMKILTACLKHDWKAAACAMEEHLTASKNATFDLILGKMDTSL